MERESPLYIFEAVVNGDEAAVREFAEKRHISLKTHDSWDQTVAHLAARKGRRSILKYLLDKEPYLQTAWDGCNYTVFHRAAQSGGLPLVKFLIDEYKMDPYTLVGDKYGNSALHVAAEGGQLDVVKYFIEEIGMDADMRNTFKQSPAFSAALNRGFGVIQYLVEWRKVKVTDVDVKNDNILFPLTRRKDLKTVRYLLDDRRVNLDVNWRGHLGKTIVYWATRIAKPDFLCYLVEEKNANINIADNNGWTPLHLSAHLGNLEATRFLIQHKANFRLKNSDGKTPVDICKHFRTRTYLEEIGNRRSRRSVSETFTPFHYLGWFYNSIQESQLLSTNTCKSVDHFDYGQFHAFLGVISLFVGYFTPYQRQKNYVQQISREQVDPIALAVLNESINLEK